MGVLVIQLTTAGQAAVQGASGSDPTVIAEIGLTETDFDYAPTLEALPGEFKRVPVTSGMAAAPNITHLTAYDTTAETWTATGIGLYLDDGTLFGVCASEDPLIAKAAVAFALLVFDIAFEADLSANIAFGNATFTYPPATEETRGVARIATQERVDAVEDGEDDAETIVTPKTLRARLAAFIAAVNDSLAAFAARTISGGGLVTGGGALTADRTLTVTKATAADALARVLDNRAVTPLALSAFVDMELVSDSANATCWRLTFGGTDYFLQMGKGTLTGDNQTTIDFPQEYTAKAYFMATGNATDVSNEGNSAQSSNTLTQGTIVNNGNPNAPYTWLAFGW